MADSKPQKGHSINPKDSIVEYWKTVIPNNLDHGLFETKSDVLMEETIK